MAERLLLPGWYVFELAFDAPTSRASLESALPGLGFSAATFDAAIGAFSTTTSLKASALAPAATSAASARVSQAVTPASIPQSSPAAPSAVQSQLARATTLKTTINPISLQPQTNLHLTALPRPTGPVNTSFQPTGSPVRAAPPPASLASAAGPRLNLGPPGGGGGGGGSPGPATASPGGGGSYDYSDYAPPTGGGGGASDGSSAPGASSLPVASSSPSPSGAIDLSKCRPIDASGRFYLCPTAPNVAVSGIVVGGAAAPKGSTFRFLARLDRAVVLRDRPGMTWLTARPFAIDPTQDPSWLAQPYQLSPGVTYDFRIISRDKTAGTHGDVETLLEAMGWAVGPLVLTRRNARVPGRPTTSVSEWLGSGTWTKSESVVTAYEPFFFADLKPSRAA